MSRNKAKLLPMFLILAVLQMVALHWVEGNVG